MNRRTFLRSLATVCGAAVVCPGELVKPDPKSGWYDVKFEPGWRKHLWMRGKSGAYIKGERTSGITDVQLRELVEVTLKDLPQDCARISFSGIDYTLCRNPKGEYYSGGYEFNK